NLRTYAPLQPLNDEELKMLENIATIYVNFPLVSCTSCQYCMLCPYGLNIPAVFSHYNKCLNEGHVANSTQDENYRQLRKIFLVGYDRSVPKLRQANHCIACNQCVSHCPQQIDIPKEMQRIDQFVEALKQGKDL
ncbi:MAG: 4Fe-4S dicluster domain-containing protein, partial [Bacteroidales bacterium]|nr:4Fe-4S dicluster domain-containing protein [Bacteroidales bacterium]